MICGNAVNWRGLSAIDDNWRWRNVIAWHRRLPDPSFAIYSLATQRNFTPSQYTGDKTTLAAFPVMMPKSFLPVCLLPLLIASCATTTEYQHKLSTWVGHSVDELYATLGLPASTEAQPDGGKVVTYDNADAAKTAPQSPPVQAKAAMDPPAPAAPVAKTKSVSCTTRYKTDAEGVIRSWTFDGDGCKANIETAGGSQ